MILIILFTFPLILRILSWKMITVKYTKTTNKMQMDSELLVESVGAVY